MLVRPKYSVYLRRIIFQWNTMAATEKKRRNGLFYTKGEERVNTLSHAAGILMGIVVGTFFLIKCHQSGDFWATFGVWLYLFGMGASYITSTIYHALKHHNPWKKRFRHWDHAAIYWHIAGSYSPVTLIALRENGAWGWGLFSFVWLCAIIGTIASFRKMKEHSHIETICFIVMGLSILIAFKPLFAVAEIPCYWIIAEGICYITGALFYSMRHRRYTHSIFHFFVLAGSACHIIAVWDILSTMLY